MLVNELQDRMRHHFREAAEPIITAVQGLEDALTRCKLTGYKGALDRYSEINSLMASETRKQVRSMLPLSPDEQKVIRDFWDAVDLIVVNILAKNCSCRVDEAYHY